MLKLALDVDVDAVQCIDVVFALADDSFDFI